MADPQIMANGLERRFGRTRAIDGVDLVVEAGEIYGFLGPNGAGKSTLTRVLCTLLTPTAGSASVAGKDVVTETMAVRLRNGTALQEAGLDDKQTGVEMLRLQGRLYGLSRQDTERRLTDLSELIDLGDALAQRIGTYSGGMKRRLDLALALMHNPSVLFLDEPTTGLDPVSRRAVWDEVRRLNRELGMTIFLTTQYLEEADELADRVGIISRGRIVAEGTPEALKRRIGTDVVVASIDGTLEPARRTLEALDEVDRVVISDDRLVASVADGPRAISPVALALAAGGVKVKDLSLRRPTLDDVFFSVTGQRIASDESTQAPTATPTATPKATPTAMEALR